MENLNEEFTLLDYTFEEINWTEISIKLFRRLTQLGLRENTYKKWHLYSKFKSNSSRVYKGM